MLKRIVGFTCAAALLSIAAVSAEQAAPQTPTQSPVQGSTPGASQQATRPALTATAGQITVTGCVTREVAGQLALSNAASSPEGATASRTEPTGAIAGSPGSSSREGATSGATGTTGSAGARADAGGVTAGAGASAGADAQGSSAPRQGTSVTASNMTYSLAGDRENELEKYVGQRVEIVGTLSASDPASTSGSAAAESGKADSRREDADDASRAPITRPEGSSAAGDGNRGNAGNPGASVSQAHTQRLNIVSFRPIGGQCS